MNIITQYKAKLATTVALNIKDLVPQQPDSLLYHFIIAYNQCSDILKDAANLFKYSDYLIISDYSEKAINCLARYTIKQYALAGKCNSIISIGNIRIKY